MPKPDLANLGTNLKHLIPFTLDIAARPHQGSARIPGGGLKYLKLFRVGQVSDGQFSQTDSMAVSNLFTDLCGNTPECGLARTRTKSNSPLRQPRLLE